MYCTECGAENYEDAKFCVVCGARLRPSVPPSSQGVDPTMEPGPGGGRGVPGSHGEGPTFEAGREGRPSWEVGLVVGGKYEILHRLGAGGMGEVYLAEDRSLGRKVAVKRLLPMGRGSRAGIERFLREARAIAALDHPGVITIYELETEGVDPYLVMEYLEGEDLGTLVRREGPLELEKALEIVKAVGEALAYAHKRGIVHRDVKPSNILLDKKGSPKLLDFGLAQVGGQPEVLQRADFLRGWPALRDGQQRPGARNQWYRPCGRARRVPMLRRGRSGLREDFDRHAPGRGGESRGGGTHKTTLRKIADKSGGRHSRRNCRTEAAGCRCRETGNFPIDRNNQRNVLSSV